KTDGARPATTPAAARTTSGRTRIIRRGRGHFTSCSTRADNLKKSGLRALTSQTMDPITRAILVKELKALEIDVRARPFDTVFRVGRTSATLRKSSWKVTFFAGRRRPAANDGRNFASFAGFAGGAAGGILAPEKGHGLSD